jgi:hypothetical protein
MTIAFLDALHADPWADNFIDLPSLNASASAAIENNIKRARDMARDEPRALRSNSLVVLGPPGAGKTHLFARLRRKLGPRAAFVHVRPLVHAGMTPRFLLGEIVKQLSYATHGVAGVPQTHALVGSLLAHLDGEDTFFPSAFLAECEAMSDADREVRLDGVVERVFELWPEADESYLRRLLEVPFARSAATRRALLAWLSARDCDVTQLTRIGATSSLDEELAMPALRTLVSVASLGAPIVVVFDQLENLIDAEGPGVRLLSYANLTSELVDSMRGLVLVHMALDTEWSRGIEPALNLSQRSRLLMGRETLSLPTPKQSEELLGLWLEQLPERPSTFPWPFTESQAERLCRRPGVTPRMLLVELKRTLNGDVPDAVDQGVPNAGAEPSSEQAGVLRAWEEKLAAARNSIDEAAEQRACIDPARLADGLMASHHFVQGLTFSGAKGAEAGELRFSLPSKAGRMVLLHQNHFKSLGAALKKLTVIAEREPIIAIRERAHELLPTWKDTLAKRSGLLATGRARWVWLERDDAASLLALDSLLQAARSRDITDAHGSPLSEDEVRQWVRSNLEIASWTIIREIKAEHAAETDAEDPSADDSAAPLPAAPATSTAGAALMLLNRFRVASLDRIVREVVRADPRATRASVIAELEQNANSVRWFGRTILTVRVS